MHIKESVTIFFDTQLFLHNWRRLM